MLDLYSNLDAVQSLGPAARTADADGTGVDLAGFHSAMVVFDAGAWTDGTHTFDIEESDDDGGTDAYASVDSSDLQGTPPTVDGATKDDQIYRVGYFGSKRYIRAVVAVTGSPSTGLVAAAAVLRGHPTNAPV